MYKGLQQEILKSFRDGSCFKVCTPTHKAPLMANAKIILNLFNISPVDYTYIKTTINKHVTWIFIDEVSVISSKIWSVIRDFKYIFEFMFVVVGDHYDIVHNEVFAEIYDGQMNELTQN
jgi:hypothetical protein